MSSFVKDGDKTSDTKTTVTWEECTKVRIPFLVIFCVYYFTYLFLGFLETVAGCEVNCFGWDWLDWWFADL